MSRPEPPTGAQLEIRGGGQAAVVTEVGAALRSWTVGGEEMLDGFRADEAAPDFRGKVLAPWPNRLRDGRYEFGGAEQRTPITEPDRGSALHGLLAWRAWRVREHTEDRVALAAVIHPQPGYPFTLRVIADYRIDADGLAVTLAAHNDGSVPLPFGLGAHPYLRPGALDGTRLRMPARELVPADAERLLPTGPPVPVAGTQHDFRRPRPIGGLALNTCFTALERDADELARVRLAGPEREMTVWMDAGYGFAMAYTADDVADPARRRGGIAIEPMTCAPDAFNTGLGLRVLEPGESFEARWGLSPGA
jgi:aldose 1-epimerase